MSERERQPSSGDGAGPAERMGGQRAPEGEEEGGRGRAWRDVERYLERKALRERLRDIFDEEPPDLDLPDD